MTTKPNIFKVLDSVDFLGNMLKDSAESAKCPEMSPEIREGFTKYRQSLVDSIINGHDGDFSLIPIDYPKSHAPDLTLANESFERMKQRYAFES